MGPESSAADIWEARRRSLIDAVRSTVLHSLVEEEQPHRDAGAPAVQDVGDLVVFGERELLQTEPIYFRMLMPVTGTLLYISDNCTRRYMHTQRLCMYILESFQLDIRNWRLREQKTVNCRSTMSNGGLFRSRVSASHGPKCLD